MDTAEAGPVGPFSCLPQAWTWRPQPTQMAMSGPSAPSTPRPDGLGVGGPAFGGQRHLYRSYRSAVPGFRRVTAQELRDLDRQDVRPLTTTAEDGEELGYRLRVAAGSNVLFGIHAIRTD